MTVQRPLPHRRPRLAGRLRRSGAGAVACAALLWLAGCGGGDGGTPPPAQGPEV